MEELDYTRLIGRIVNSMEFRELNYKGSPIDGFLNAILCADAVAEYANDIALELLCQDKLEINNEYCELLAYIKYLGIPAYGREGKIALEETFGKTYPQSEINIILAKKKLRIELPEKMIEDIRQMEYENLEDVTSNEARCVLIAQSIREDLKLLTEEEKKKLGGILLSETLTEECSIDEKGKVIPGELYKKITPTLQKRRRPIDQERVEKAKKHLEDSFLESVIGQAVTKKDERDDEQK